MRFSGGEIYVALMYHSGNHGLCQPKGGGHRRYPRNFDVGMVWHGMDPAVRVRVTVRATDALLVGAGWFGKSWTDKEERRQ